MNYLELAKQQLLVDEGKVAHAYQDSEGFWTIGVGRLIDRRVGGCLTDDEIDYLLVNDIERAEEDAKVLFPSFPALSDTRKAVLVNMAFNLGRNRLSAFKRFRAAVEAGEWEQAAAEMLDSRWAEQVKGRAVRLAQQMREG